MSEPPSRSSARNFIISTLSYSRVAVVTILKSRPALATCLVEGVVKILGPVKIVKG